MNERILEPQGSLEEFLVVNLSAPGGRAAFIRGTSAEDAISRYVRQFAHNDMEGHKTRYGNGIKLAACRADMALLQHKVLPS